MSYAMSIFDNAITFYICAKRKNMNKERPPLIYCTDILYRQSVEQNQEKLKKICR